MPSSVPTADPALDKVEFARAALTADVGADAVGDLLGVQSEAPGLATYEFETRERGYRGWRWAVTVAQVGSGVESDLEPTVDEIVLLPGDGAILAPVWVPWRERIKPGDLSPGDLLPADEDDTRLVPGYFAGDSEVDRHLATMVADEVGLGRPRVLSPEGADLAAERWFAGDPGPDVPMAQSAPGRCIGCGFLVRLSGVLANHFGVCANEYANDDGRVVSFNHGCGAHSEAQLRKKQLPPPLPDPVFDTVSRDDLESF